MHSENITTDFTGKKELLEKLHAILTDVEYIEKDAENKFDHYFYASEKAIKLALHEAFKVHKVMMFVNQVDATTLDMSNKGEVIKVTVTPGLCTFVDIETGQSITIMIQGAGNGRNDKGIYAALTGLIKYALTSTFLIPTGDDAEADGELRPSFRKIEKQDPPLDERKKPVQQPWMHGPCPTTPPTPPAPVQTAPGKKTVKKAVVKKEEEKKDEVKIDEGTKTEGSAKISEAEIKKIISAFAVLGFTQEELESCTSIPIKDLTYEMKADLNKTYQMLKKGAMTKAQWMTLED